MAVRGCKQTNRTVCAQLLFRVEQFVMLVSTLSAVFSIHGYPASTWWPLTKLLSREWDLLIWYKFGMRFHLEDDSSI